MDLRNYLENISNFFTIKKVFNELSIEYEIPKVIKLMDKGPILKFLKIKNYSNFQAVANIVNSKVKLYKMLNVNSDVEFYKKLLEAEDKACSSKLELTNNTTYQVVNDLNLEKLPIPRYYENEPRYITSAIVFGLDVESGFQNASIHRLSIIDVDKFVIRLVPRHLYSIHIRNKKLGKNTPVGIVWGTHPLTLLAASSSPPFGYPEISLANELLGGELKVYQLSNGVYVPASAEIVMEGFIMKDVEVEEKPCVDVLGTYDESRKQPVVKITKIYLRLNEHTLAHILVPACSEHMLLMGIEKEAKIWKFVSNVVPEVNAVRLTSGGCGWLHAVISIKKQNDGDPKNVILAAFAAHPSLKHVIVVDDDVYIDNLEEVEWAIATRFRADEDLIIIKYIKGSTLDPSSIDQVTGLTTKVGIDATKPLTKNSKKFEKAKIPVDINLKELIIE